MNFLSIGYFKVPHRLLRINNSLNLFLFFSATTSSTSTPAPSPCVVKLTPEKIKHKSCISQEKVLLASCSGACQSSASFLLEAPYFQQDCSCCRPTEFEDLDVSMFCLAKRSSTINDVITIKRIKTCDCSPCNAKPVLPTATSDNTSEEAQENEDSKKRKRRSVTSVIYDMIFGN